MKGMEEMTILTSPERRCATCGAKASGKACGECGSPVVPRVDIGILAGVNNNFGTVNNVYNIGGQPETEIVDLRDVQDGLNDRFPERVPVPPTAPRQLGNGSITRKVNVAAYVAGAIFLIGALGLIASFLWA